MNYNAWAKEFHETGLHEKPISDDEYAALFRSEFRTAFHEHRRYMPYVYQLCEKTGERCNPACTYFSDEHDCSYHKSQPCFG